MGRGIIEAVLLLHFIMTYTINLIIFFVCHNQGKSCTWKEIFDGPDIYKDHFLMFRMSEEQKTSITYPGGVYGKRDCLATAPFTLCLFCLTASYPCIAIFPFMISICRRFSIFAVLTSGS